MQDLMSGVENTRSENAGPENGGQTSGRRLLYLISRHILNPQYSVYVAMEMRTTVKIYLHV